MKLKEVALFMLVASSTVVAISCGGSKKSNTSPTNTTSSATIQPGSDATLHDGSAGPVYEVPHPTDCGTCAIASTTDVDGCPSVIGTSVACEGTCFVDSNITTTYNNNPPTSGPEYDYYDYNFYDIANLPRGEYVRQMYHGYVVMAYNCTSCDAMLDQLKPYATLGTTPLPGYGVVLTQDTALPENSFYALSWTWSYQFSAFDKTSLECFIKQHSGHGLDASSDPNAVVDPNATN